MRMETPAMLQPVKRLVRNRIASIVHTETAKLETRCVELEAALADLKTKFDATTQIADNSALHAQILELQLQKGLLETQVHDSNYWTTLFRWRYQSLSKEHWGDPLPSPTPPREIPAALMPAFTMDGRVPIEPGGWDNETRPANWPLVYTDAEIDHYIGMIKSRQWFIYGMTDYWLWDALTEFPATGQSVAIMGSTTPWYESTCIHFGGRPVTIEYNTIKVHTRRMEAVTVADFERAPRVFDAAISISSFEHDGLGRYGDPLDPDGDLKAMQNMKRIVRPGGLLYLAVPVGRDRILFNAARVYGPIRFPLLIDGWIEVARYGFGPGAVEAEGSIQPVIVLRNGHPPQVQAADTGDRRAPG